MITSYTYPQARPKVGAGARTTGRLSSCGIVTISRCMANHRPSCRVQVRQAAVTGADSRSAPVADGRSAADIASDAAANAAATAHRR